MQVFIIHSCLKPCFSFLNSSEYKLNGTALRLTGWMIKYKALMVEIEEWGLFSEEWRENSCWKGKRAIKTNQSFCYIQEKGKDSKYQVSFKIMWSYVYNLQDLYELKQYTLAGSTGSTGFFFDLKIYLQSRYLVIK